MVAEELKESSSKKAESRRIVASELWCWRRLLRVSWKARRSNQSILKEIIPEYSLEVMVKLKLQYFGHLMEQPTHWKRPWCWERLKTEGEEGDRGWNGWMASLIQWTKTWANYGIWWGTEKPGRLQSMASQRFGHDLVTNNNKFMKISNKLLYICFIPIV